MADATPSLRIPPGAVSIVRDAQSAGVLYTVPTGFRLHIVAAWLSCQGNTTAGAVAIQAAPENDGSTRNVLRLDVIGSLFGTLSVTHQDVPVTAGQNVGFVNAGTAPLIQNGGFSGWLEALTK